MASIRALYLEILGILGRWLRNASLAIEKIHRKVKRISNIDELLRYFPGMKASVDATEQEIPRPKNRRRRKSYYSGKRSDIRSRRR